MAKPFEGGRGEPGISGWRDEQNAIRTSAIGKENPHFIAFPEDGGRSAIIHSVLVTCHTFGVDPHDCPRDVLGPLPTMTNRDDVAALKPRNGAPRHGAAPRIGCHDHRARHHRHAEPPKRARFGAQLAGCFRNEALARGAV